MSEILQHTIWNNSIQHYLVLGFILLVILLFQGVLARFISNILFKTIGKLVPDADEKEFHQLLVRPFQVLIIIIGLAIIFQSLSAPTFLTADVFGYNTKDLWNRFAAMILVFAISWILLRIIDFLGLILHRKAENTASKSDDQIVFLAKDLAKLAIVLFAILFILGNTFKLNVSALLAGAGIAGIAIALAAKESLENLLATFTIFLEKPFTVGDYIQIGSASGIVEKVGFRSTRLRTTEKTFITIPNRRMIDSAMDNMSLRSMRRINFTLGLNYDTQPKQMRIIIEEIKKYLENNKLTEGSVTVAFTNFGETSLDILIQYYLNEIGWDTFVENRQEINFRIMEIIEDQGAKFAYPTTRVVLEKDFNNQ